MAFQPTQKSGSRSPQQFADEVKTGATNFVKNEMLGLDDFSNAKKKAESGNWAGAVKSGLTGLGEVGLTAASLGVGTGIRTAAKFGAKAAIKKATTKTVATQSVKKAESFAAKPRYSNDVFAPKVEAKPTDGYPVNPKAKVEEAPKAKVEKKPSKLGRAAAFGAGYALAKDDSSQNDPAKWKASAVI